jgi:hypothetical protein
MKKIAYADLEKRFQYTAGISQLDTWEKAFFLTALNRRLKEAWDYAEWPVLKEINYSSPKGLIYEGALIRLLKDTPWMYETPGPIDSVFSSADIGRQIIWINKQTSWHGLKQFERETISHVRSDNLAIGFGGTGNYLLIENEGTNWEFYKNPLLKGDYATVKTVTSYGNYKWQWPTGPNGVVGERRIVLNPWDDNGTSTIIGEVLVILSISESNNKTYRRDDNSVISSNQAQYESQTRVVKAEQRGEFIPLYQGEWWEFLDFPDFDVLGIFSENPYTDKRATPIDFKLLNGQVHLDPSYASLDKVWILTKKPFIQISAGQSVPAIFQNFLLSSILADFYRADGQQNKAMYEDQRAEKALDDQVDKLERQNLQAQVPVITYTSPNTKRYVQL